MKNQVALLALATQATAFTLPIGARVPPSEGIVGGKDAKIEDFPFQVGLKNNNRAWCGGSIVSSKYIVTAAHCIVGVKNPTTALTVRVGSDNINEGTVYNLTAVYPDSRFNRSTNDYDIAVLELSKELEFSSKVKAIQLVDETVPAEGSGIVSGWGDLKEGDRKGSPKLQYVEVPLVSQDDCNTNYDGKITDRMICAGLPEGGKDSCQGDSGGPFTVGGKLAGVVSWGYGCARPNLPGIYADVGNAELRQYIKDKTGL